jgi:cytochrome c oxidase cbb3-type subunit IV
MYKDILQSITGVEVFPVISLVLFVIVFAAVLISVARMDRTRATGLAGLPLDDSSDPTRPENPR